MRVSVITPTFRPWDRLLLQLEDLKAQTLQDFEWIVVDDLWDKRPFMLEGPFPIKHVPPYHGVSEYDAGSHAVNTGLVYATGELVHFMNDYVRLNPTVLQTHWDIYREYGPKVFISGPRVSIDGQSEVDPRARRDMSDRLIDEGVGEFLGALAPFSAGVNDSVPLALLLKLGGINEGWDGGHGSSDYDLAARLFVYGCRYLVSLDAPAYECPRPITQKKRAPTRYDVFGETFLDIINGYGTRQRSLVLKENAWILKARRELCASFVLVP